jgi:peptidoglycan/LPS O-acetylase OafA/YrhL
MTTAPAPHPPDNRRLPEIEVLRAIAVMGVVFHHAYGNLITRRHHVIDLLNHQVDFATGVDLFFAISGFVIARTLLPSIGGCRSARQFITVAAAFWIRRAARLLPSAWVWLLLILAAAAWFNRTGVFGSVQTNAWALLAGVLDYANLRFAWHFGKSFYGASFAWWSLSLEEQFYLLLPPLAFLFGRFLWPLLVLVVLVQFPTVPDGLLGVVFRNQAIVLGVLLAIAEPGAWFARPGAWLANRPRWLQAALSLALILALGALGARGLVARAGIGLIALASVALVYLAAQDRGLILRDGLPRRLLAYVGARSYGIYLIHVPAFFAARELFSRAGFGGTPSLGTEFALCATAMAILLLCAELNWRLLEHPLRIRGARAAQRFAARRAA